MKSKIKVNFIICGTQKGGSTALAKFVGQHPQIAFAAKKECHFFDQDKYFQDSEVNYSVYHKNWTHVLLNPKKRNTCKVYGEATPIYMYWELCTQRIKVYNPKMKLIFILRNPVDRAYSQWNMFTQQGKESLSFSEAIRSENSRILESKIFDNQYSYIHRGFYAQQIKRIMTLFPREQMLFLRNENLRQDPQQTLDLVFDFLGVEPYQEIESEEVNSRVYEPMLPDDRKFLQQQFSQDIIDLENLLNWDLSDWKLSE